jgi:hypothetical protein
MSGDPLEGFYRDTAFGYCGQGGIAQRVEREQSDSEKLYKDWSYSL